MAQEQVSKQVTERRQQVTKQGEKNFLGRSAVADASSTFQRQSCTDFGENSTRGPMALWAPWPYGPHGPMGPMALLAPWPYGPCAILALCLIGHWAVAHRAYKAPGPGDHTAHKSWAQGTQPIWPGPKHYGPIQLRRPEHSHSSTSMRFGPNKALFACDRQI